MFKDLDKVVDSFRRIARDTSKSSYIRAKERDKKTEIVNDGNIVEYN